MSALLDQFRAAGIAFTALPDGRLHAAGPITDATRATIREHKAAILAELVAANDDAAPRWRVQFPNVDPMEVIFAPEATRAEVAAIYPGARVEPLFEPVRRMATPEQAAELRELVAVILSDADDGERADVLRVAIADAEAALTSFRLLAADAMERKRQETRFGSA